LISTVFSFLNEYWLPLVFLLFVAYQVFDYFNFKGHLEKVGQRFCDTNGVEYIGIKHAKAHFSVIFKTPENGKRKYRKFRMNTSFLWKMNYFEWID